jgi:TFIIF-interacting CTD phosphatase-like protein
MKKCIALDIDGTLFYSKDKEFPNSIKLDNGYYTKTRPLIDMLFDYLENNTDKYKVIIYSAATKDYIDEHLKIIDKSKIIENVFDRKYCDHMILNNNLTYVKNAKNIKEDITNTYLIDDNNYHFNEFNILGYKCKPYKGEEDDHEIFEIIDFLETLNFVN